MNLKTLAYTVSAIHRIYLPTDSCHLQSRSFIPISNSFTRFPICNIVGKYSRLGCAEKWKSPLELPAPGLPT